MNELSFRDRELVALGAAVAANCVPCVRHHVPKALEAGLTTEELTEAVALADTVRRVPARMVLEAATDAIGCTPGTQSGTLPDCAEVSADSTAATAPGKRCC